MKKPVIEILYMEQPETKVIGKQKYKLLNDWSCCISVNGKLITVKTDAGAEWDGASIPRVFWSLLGIYPGGRMLAPSLPHDGWCRSDRGDIPKWFHVISPVIVAPYIRDLIFRESCRRVGILNRRSRIMWFSVVIYQRIQSRRYKIKYK